MLQIVKIIEPTSDVPAELQRPLEGYSHAGYSHWSTYTIPLTQNALTTKTLNDFVQKTNNAESGIPLGRAIVNSVSDFSDSRITSAAGFGADDNATPEKGFLRVKASISADKSALVLNVSAGDYASAGYANVHGTTNEDGVPDKKELDMSAAYGSKLRPEARTLFNKLDTAVNDALKTDDLNTLLGSKSA